MLARQRLVIQTSCTTCSLRSRYLTEVRGKPARLFFSVSAVALPLPTPATPAYLRRACACWDAGFRDISNRAGFRARIGSPALRPGRQRIPVLAAKGDGERSPLSGADRSGRLRLLGIAVAAAAGVALTLTLQGDRIEVPVLVGCTTVHVFSAVSPCQALLLCQSICLAHDQAGSRCQS